MADRASARGRRRTEIRIGPFGFRSGSLPDRLLRWARARGRPFGIAEIVETLGGNPAHAQRLVTRARRHLKHLAYGVRVEARVYGRAAPATRRAWRRAANAEPGSFRPGTLVDRLARWAAGRTAPFRPRDAARAVGVSLQHAMRMMQRARAKGIVERLAWGTYVGPGVGRSAIRAWREERRNPPLRAGGLPDRLVRWAAGRRRPFGIGDAMRALRVRYGRAWGAMRTARVHGRLERLSRGAYAVVRRKRSQSARSRGTGMNRVRSTRT